MPLSESENAKARYQKTFYPEQLSAEKQITINGLREHSWYYICIEWESFNRHNTTTGAVTRVFSRGINLNLGTECQLYQTLDRFGKSSDTVVTDAEVMSMRDLALTFRLRTENDFPVRLTAYLKGSFIHSKQPHEQLSLLSGGQFSAPAQTIYSDAPSDVDLLFTNLRPDTLYGRLCIVEEPQPTAYTAMARLIRPTITGLHCKEASK